MVCDHVFEPRSGRPLACCNCGELWPGDPDWPPEYRPRVVGYGETAKDHVPWGQRVDRVVAELAGVE